MTKYMIAWNPKRSHVGAPGCKTFSLGCVAAVARHLGVNRFAAEQPLRWLGVRNG